MKKKKIAIVTFSSNLNYGGTLQEYALYEILKEKYNVKCIDYKDDIVISNLKMIRTGFILKFIKIVKSKYNIKQSTLHINTNRSLSFILIEGIKRTKVMFRDILHLNSRRKLISKFNLFWKQFLKKTKPYTEQELLDGKSEKFDIYISGSDQIWNPIYVGLSPIYYLDFTPIETKKISYASSFGNYNFQNKNINNKIKQWILNFHAISVREKKSTAILKDLFRIDVKNVLDPTLLIDKEKWLNLMKIKKKKEQDNYLLVYSLNNNYRNMLFAKKVGKTLGLNIYILDNRYLFDLCSKNKHISTAGPREFVDLFAHASFIITDSFHGTAFSINFNIPFFTIKSSIPQRQIDLLNRFKLTDRLLSKHKLVQKDYIYNIDFTEANTILKKERKISMDYLISSIED